MCSTRNVTLVISEMNIFVLKVSIDSCDVVEACFKRLILHANSINNEYDLCNIDESNCFYITHSEFF